MRQIIFFLTFIITIGGLAQGSGNTESDIHLSVVTPSTMEGLSSSQISRIESKLQQMVTNYGISGEGYFIIYPKYEIYDESLIEGMRNMHLLEADLNLIVKEVQTGKVYNSYSQNITGDGYSKKKAIDQSISQIKTRGPEIEAFLAETKQKILDYYRSNCDQFYSEAGTMIGQKRYREAIALLYPVPRGTGDACFNKVQKRLNEAYSGYMNETCEKNLVKARNAIAENNDKTALEALDEIDPESNCYKSAQKLNQELNVKLGGRVQAGVSTETSFGTSSDKVKKKRSHKIEVIAEAQYRSRHQMEMANLTGN